MNVERRQFPQPRGELVYFQNKDPDDGRIVVYDGQSYRDQNAGPGSAPLETFDVTQFVEVSRLRMHNCTYGQYPWDHWQQWALADGVPDDLAQLGRDLIREADQHNWPADLQAECGWNDNGAAMIELALKEPEAARKRWHHLMETDGERV